MSLHNVIATVLVAAPESAAHALVDELADLDAAAGLSEHPRPTRGHLLAVTVSVEATSPAVAAVLVEQRLLDVCYVTLVGLEAMSTAEFDRRVMASS